MTRKTGVYLAPIMTLQPSQLYISEKKLARVQLSIDFLNLENIPPVPITMLAGDKVMTDGHTRTLAAYLAGLERVPIYDDRDELDWDAYQICVGWCRAAGITSVADLLRRVLSPDDYERLWMARCRAMQAELAHERGDT